MKVRNHNFLIHHITIRNLVIFIILLSVSQMAWAQPTVLGTQVVDGLYQKYDLASVGIFKQYRLQATSSAAVSTRNWEFARGTAASTDYSINWRPYFGGNTLAINSFIPIGYANGASYNTGSGGASGLLPAITNGNYYTFNVSNNSAADNVMQLLETSYNPVTISAVTQSVGDNGAENISISTSTTPNAAEYIYVRFSTNSYTNSTLVQATGSGTSWSATIPWQASAVSYYVYSSNKALSQINSDVGTYGQNVHDMSTLNLNNNGGSNYSWSFGNIIVKSTGGSAATGAAYSSLTVAGLLFSALNTGIAHTGAVTVFVCASTTETGATALNHSSNWTSVNMYPINSDIALSGSVTAPLIDLNGADNVTIDGRVNAIGSTSSLVIENTSADALATTFTMQGVATNNTLRYCMLKGSSQYAETAGGAINILGNASQSNNEISYNIITASSGGRPINAIFCGENTTGLDIVYNQFENVVKTNGIRLVNGGTSIAIGNNSFYETVAFTPTSEYSFIKAGGNSGNGFNGLAISTNYLGGSATECGGTLTTTGLFAYNLNGISIYDARTRDGITISNNTIKNISWENNAQTVFKGINIAINNTSVSPDTNSSVLNNFISNITFSNSAGDTEINGIYYSQKNVNIYNNIVSLGTNHRATIYGIRLASAATANTLNVANIYFNTIYIGGQPTTGAYDSYGFYSNYNGISRDIRNNIFYNARSNSGATGKHYAAYFDYSTMISESASFSCNYNNYYVSGTGGTLGYAGADKTTLADLRTATGGDAQSNATDPGISIPDATAISYKGSAALVGVAVAAVAGDFIGRSRSTTPNIGAWEINNYPMWQGTTSSDWNTASNWYDNAVPASGNNFTFHITPTNHAALDQDRVVSAVINAQSTYDLVANGHKLTIEGALQLSNGGKIDASAASSTIEFAGSAMQTIENTNFKDNTIYNLTIGNAAGVIQNSDLTVSNVFTINSGKWYQINAGKALTVSGTVTNSAGVGGLLIKAGNNTTANASFIYPQGQTAQATVEFYSKASWDKSAAAFSRYKWQYFGIPVSAGLNASPTFDGAFVRKFNEAGVGAGISNSPVKRWLQLTNASEMTPFAGYEIVQAAATTYTIQGTLVNTDFNSGQLTYTTNPVVETPGSHVFSNPYTAAIDIQQLTFGSETEASVYQFHTGSHNDWTGTGGSNGFSTGQYITSPRVQAGTGEIPRYISSMQGFLIKKLNNNADNLSNFTFSIPYNAVKAKNTTAMRSPKQEKSYTTIDVTGNRFADKVWIFIDENCSRAYDNGWDGRKILGSVLTPQLLIRETQNDLQISAVDDINNTVLAFQPGEDAAYTLTFKHTNIVYPELYLIDNETNSVTDISASGSAYSFTATASTVPVERFKIVTGSKITTGYSNIKTDTKIFSNKNSVFVNNKSNCSGTLKLIDLTGKILLTKSIDANTLIAIETKLGAGNYMAVFETCERKFHQTILLK